MLRSSWMPGPAAGLDGPALVTVTAFRADKARDLPGIARTGYLLRRLWPELEGAVGMWLWAQPRERRCGSVSVWQDEHALRQFVGLPAHVAVMRRYRGRGLLTSTNWTGADRSLRAIWAAARPHLSGTGTQ